MVESGSLNLSKISITMKTSLTLSILGAYNALMGVLMLFSTDKMAITMIGANRAG